MRSLVSASSLLLAASLLGCGMPASFDGPHGIKGVYAGYSFAYVVPVAGGVVVVDAGGEKSAAALKDAIGGRPVKAVLVTHAHSDHVDGLEELGDVPVYIGRAEAPLLKGDRKYKGAVQVVTGAASMPPKVPADLRLVDAGDVVAFDNMTFTAVDASGHTPGSMAWLVGDVLFVGDAASGGKDVARSPWFFDDDIQKSDETVKALWGLDFKTMLDGHHGATEHAEATVRGAR